MPWTKVAVDRAVRGLFCADKNAAGRILTYRQALREALYQALKRDPGVFIMGEGVDDPDGVFGSTVGLHKEFGGRVFDTPIAENALTGFAVGAALSGMRPVLVHMRMDFLPLSFDQIINHASKLCYMSGGQVHVPLVIRAVIGRGWGSAAQHSQALQSVFAHIPGLKVVMPATPYDAKGLLISCVMDGNPVVYIDERWLHNHTGDVPEEMYTVPIGKGVVRREGKDVTVVATSYMVFEAMKAAEILEKEGIDIEVIDLRTVKPLDDSLIFGSVRKTGRLVVADGGWKSFGAGAEIIARVVESDVFRCLRASAVRVSLPDIPAPASRVLEKEYYPDEVAIASSVRKLMERNSGV